jgi:hypothetical protein
MSTATIFGSFPNPAAQRATAPAAASAVAPMFDSFSRDGAPLPEPTNAPADVGSAATASIFESYSNHLAVVPAAEPGPVTAFGAWLTRIQQAFDRWTESNAQSRADARLWDIARSDPRIMGELMHARMRDDSETLVEPVAVLAMPAAPVLEATPTVRQPHQRTAGQGWGRIIEDAYQNRFHKPRHQHA